MFFKSKKQKMEEAKKAERIRNNFAMRTIGMDPRKMLCISYRNNQYDELCKTSPEKAVQAAYGWSIMDEMIKVMGAIAWYHPVETFPILDRMADDIKENAVRLRYGEAEMVIPLLGYVWESIDNLAMDAEELAGYNRAHGTNMTLRSLVETYIETAGLDTLEKLYDVTYSDSESHDGKIEDINRFMGGYDGFMKRLYHELDKIWEDSQGLARFMATKDQSAAKTIDALPTTEDKRTFEALYLYVRVQFTRRFGNDEYLMANDYFKKTYEWQPKIDISKWIQ